MFCNLTGPDQIGPTQNDDRIVPLEKERKFTDGGNYEQCDMWKPRVIPLGDSQRRRETLLDAGMMFGIVSEKAEMKNELKKAVMEIKKAMYHLP
jgi:hypothetical protein